MKKWWWLAIGVTIALLLVTLMLGICYFARHRHRSVAMASKPELVIKIDTRIPTQQQVAIMQSIAQYVEQNGKTARQDNNAANADLVVSVDADQPNHQPIAWQR